MEADGGPLDNDENYDDQHWKHYDHVWQDGAGGNGTKQDTEIIVNWYGTVSTNATSAEMEWSSVDGVELDAANNGSVTTNEIGLPVFGDEHCKVNDPKNPPPKYYVFLLFLGHTRNRGAL